MNRLGLHLREQEEAIHLLKKFGRSTIDHLMAHYANSSLPFSDTLNKKQREAFSCLKRDLRGSGISLSQTSVSNSGACEQGEGLEETHIRPGLMLYGPSALLFRPKNPWRGRIISTLTARVIQSYTVEKGEAIGYGGTPAPVAGAVSILAIGYADGLIRAYGGGSIPYKGGLLNIFGNISMDTMHLFAEKGLSYPREGELIPLWGHGHFEDLLNHSTLSPYEMFCLLGRRLPRVYRLK